MKGRGLTFGAISLLNAIAGGKGGTASVRLVTECIVDLDHSSGDWRFFINDVETNSKLAHETTLLALKMAGKAPEEYSGTVRTVSQIPIGAGLKSSSSASSAIALAVSAALGQKAFDPHRIMNVSVEASLASGASVTGAMDDAASCLLGGLNLADNLGRRIEKSRLFDKTLKVLIKVPDAPSKRNTIDTVYFKKFSRVTDVLFRMCLSGDYWRAMTLNGTLYSALLSYDPSPALQAIEHGALGASLSGTGPSTAAVFETSRSDEMGQLRKAWSSDGSEVIETETNNEHGRIESLG